MQKETINDNNDHDPIFTKCINCNKLVNLIEGAKSQYCSISCSEKFQKCPVCGKYFTISDQQHHNSLKCLIDFDIDKTGKPFIKQTSFKIFISANPLYSGELVSKQIAENLKLPLFMSEQIRIESALSLSQVKTHIEENMKKEKNDKYFIYIDNSYSYDFIEEFHKSFNFDKYIIIGKEKTEELAEDYNTSSVKLCTKCGNINCFSELSKTGKEFLTAESLKCLICDNQFFRTTVENATIRQKLKNYESCKNHIIQLFHDKYVNFDFMLSSLKTSDEILKYFIYES